MSYDMVQGVDNDELMRLITRLYSELRLAFVDRPECRIAVNVDAFGDLKFYFRERIGDRFIELGMRKSIHGLLRVPESVFRTIAFDTRVQYQRRLMGEIVRFENEDSLVDMTVFGLTIEEIYQLKNFAQLHDYHPDRDGEARYYYGRY